MKVFFIDDMDFLHHHTANDGIPPHHVLEVMIMTVVSIKYTIHIPYFTLFYKGLVRVLATHNRYSQ